MPLADARKIWETEGGESESPAKSMKAQRPDTGGMRIAILISRGSPEPEAQDVEQDDQED